MPVIARLLQPSRAGQPQQGQAGSGAGGDRVRADRLGERVRGIDYGVYTVCPGPVGQARRAAEPADPDLTGRERRVADAARQ
jgi:hypothetical protein